jgi:hypothetical protein
MLHAWLMIAMLATGVEPSSASTVVVVIGAPGTPEYADQFLDWTTNWRSAAAAAKAEFVSIGGKDDQAAAESDFDRLKTTLREHSGEHPSTLWLVLIGHGTFDGQTAKFNLRGPDLAANDLAAWLAGVKRPVAIINCASASAPFINKLSGADRVIVTATQSGNEQNFARFGQFLSAAIGDRQADLDKDDQVSLLEAYLTACRQVSEYYEQQSRLATEHALLDDNGDALGTPAAWFRGLRAVHSPKEAGAVDGTRAHQAHLIASDREAGMPPEVRERRNELELEIERLRTEKPQVETDQYYARLERLLVELARLYHDSG